MNLPTLRLFLFCSATAFLSLFPMCYHTADINIPEILFKEFVNESYSDHYRASLSTNQMSSLWAFINAVFIIGGFFGALWSEWIMTKAGLRFSIVVVANVIHVIGCVLLAVMSISNSFELLIIGRFITGVSSGLSSTALPVYIAECSPDEFRGSVVSMIGILSNLSTTIALVLTLPMILGSANSLNYLAAFPVLISIVQMSCAWIFPDSPKRIYLNQKDKQKAVKSIRFYHGANADVPAILSEYDHEALLESETLSLSDILQNRALRQPLVLSVLSNVGAYFCGIIAVQTYSTQIVGKAGIDHDFASYATIVAMAVQVPASILSSILMERVGRRRMLLGGYSLSVVCLIGFTIFPKISGKAPAYLNIVCLLLFLFAFAVGPLPISYILPSELLPFASRPAGNALALAASWLSIVITLEIYGPLNNVIGSYVFLPFAAVTLLVEIYMAIYLPETRGTSSEEVANMFEKGPKLERAIYQDDKM